MKNKIIFLDIDGVLNSDKFYERCTSKGMIWVERRIDPDAVKRLKIIVDETNAEIVVTSTWRRVSDDMSLLERHLRAQQLQVFDKTPMLYKSRGDEISAWFKIKPSFRDANYVILDDDADMTIHIDHLVQTNYKTGLTDEDVRKAIKILNAKE